MAAETVILGFVSENAEEELPVVQGVAVTDTEPPEAASVATRYKRSVKQAEKNLLKSHNRFHQSIGSLLSAYEDKPFAGRTLRNCEGQEIPSHNINFLPPWIVPMYAPFCEPFVGDWLQAFSDCVDYLKRYDHMNFEGGERKTVLIPIHSMGGNVNLLRSMLKEVEALRGDKHKYWVNDKDGNPNELQVPKVTIITHAVGMVASCGFVFYQCGDQCYTSSDARLLCHEPSFNCPVQVQQNGNASMAQTAEDADKASAELRELKDYLYNTAELQLLVRYCRNVYRWAKIQAVDQTAEWIIKAIATANDAMEEAEAALEAARSMQNGGGEEISTKMAVMEEAEKLRKQAALSPEQERAVEAAIQHEQELLVGINGKARVAVWREVWGKQHILDMGAFAEACRYSPKEMHKIAYESDMNIMTYITRRLAQDEHNKAIEARWAWRLSLCDHAGVNLQFEMMESVHMQQDHSFVGTLLSEAPKPETDIKIGHKN